MLCYAVNLVPSYVPKGQNNLAARIMIVSSSPHDPPAVTTVNTDTVVRTDRDANVGSLVLAPASALGISVPSAVAVASLRLNDKPCLTPTIVFLLHELELRPVAARWSRRLRWRWWWEHCGVLGDLQRQCGQCGRKWQRLDQCDFIKRKCRQEGSGQISRRAANNDMP